MHITRGEFTNFIGLRGHVRFGDYHLKVLFQGTSQFYQVTITIHQGFILVCIHEG